LAGLTAGQLRVTTNVIAKDIFERHADAGLLYVAEMTAAMYCSAIRDDTSTTDSEKTRRVSELTQQVFRFVNADYKPVIPVPATIPIKHNPSLPSATRTLLTSVQAFIDAHEASQYEWAQYVNDATTLYVRGREFYELLKASRVAYDQVRPIYAALDEATDVLSVRGKLMHDSGFIANDYDRHVFVGPGWFRISLQELRRAHERQTTLSNEQVAAFGSDVEYWRLCWAGIEQNGSNCK
jgi:hypothetical protein